MNVTPYALNIAIDTYLYINRELGKLWLVTKTGCVKFY